jgi:hypothetical protein
VTGQSDYDIPSFTTIGMIHRVSVTNSDDKVFWVRYDDSLDLENFPPTATGQPQYYRIVNDLLRLYPSVDATNWPTLTITASAAPAPMISDTDRPVVDAEALIRLATIDMKEYLGIGGPQQNKRMEFERYLLDLRADTSPSRSFNMASDNVIGPAYWTVPTVDAATTPFAPGWNPPGVW